MRKLELFKELRAHRKKAEQRAFDYEKNKAAKYFMYIGMLFMILYLTFIAVGLAMAANGSSRYTAIEILTSILPFVLTIDFLLRFTMQHTPTQLVKPYLLLPISKYTAVDSFIITSLLSWGNLIWFCMFIPYCIMSVVFGYGLITTFGVLLFLLLMLLGNSQWYLLMRTLINANMLFWILPLAIYGAVYTPLFVGDSAGLKAFCNMYAVIGQSLQEGECYTHLFAMGILGALVVINRRVQNHYILQEIGKSNQTKLRSVSKFSFLERYGEVGLYLQLEIKSILRNKNPKRSFLMAIAIVIVFSLLITYTEAYDDSFSRNFFCFYNFIIVGMALITRIMGNEGNYFDCLIVHHENILSLLKAKYVFYSLLVLIPFLIMLPAVFNGKYTLLMLASYAFFTIGFSYCLLLQLAVYNKQTFPLNEKITTRNGLSENYVQTVLGVVTLFLPIAIIRGLQVFLIPEHSYTVLLIVGAAFIVSSNWWLRNIYRRLMKRRYENIEAFRASR